MHTQHSPALRAWFDQLKRDIDLHDLAERLNLRRSGAKGNYHSPHHTDRSASLSIFERDCVGKRLLLARTSTEAYIAERAQVNPEPGVAYLVDWGIDPAISRRAIQAVEASHGGSAAPFIVRAMNSARVMAVGLRDAAPALNGSVKTQCQGDGIDYGRTSDACRPRRSACSSRSYGSRASRPSTAASSSMTWKSARCAHLAAISPPGLAQGGLYAAPALAAYRMAA
ncbi:hypothetical protein [Ralstonia solanacearum]|uniref:hypothetical protein n=1 Tax=Ralstonia solanacearum TaxID=305 RepID=UPI001E328D7E|nr:hypothetical protein [Ralstonia solanacearum]